MSEKTLHGSCLCGKITSNMKDNFQRFYQCYCDRCQKKTGSAFASLIFTAPDNIEWLSGEHLAKRFNLPDAVRFSNNFCTECGSQVPYLSRDGSMLTVPAGYLNDAPTLTPQANIFCEEKSSWYNEGQNAPSYDQYPT